MRFTKNAGIDTRTNQKRDTKTRGGFSKIRNRAFIIFNFSAVGAQRHKVIHTRDHQRARRGLETVEPRYTVANLAAHILATLAVHI